MFVDKATILKKRSLFPGISNAEYSLFRKVAPQFVCAH